MGAGASVADANSVSSDAKRFVATSAPAQSNSVMSTASCFPGPIIITRGGFSPPLIRSSHSAWSDNGTTANFMLLGYTETKPGGIRANASHRLRESTARLLKIRARASRVPGRRATLPAARRSFSSRVMCAGAELLAPLHSEGPHLRLIIARPLRAKPLQAPMAIVAAVAGGSATQCAWPARGIPNAVSSATTPRRRHP